MEKGRIELFGGFRICVGDRVVVERLTRRKAETLLAYLSVSSRRAIPREELCSLLWPDADEDSARKRLKQVVSLTRQDLRSDADAFLPHTDERRQISVSPNIACDAIEFENALNAAEGARTLDEAAEGARTPDEAARYRNESLNLYRGPFLPGAVEEWAERERDRFALRHRTALLWLLNHHERRGETAEALHLAQTAHHLQPLDEDALRDLLRLLVVAGQTAAALRQYREFETRLKKEWGQSPSPALYAFIAGVRTGKAKSGVPNSLFILGEPEPVSDATLDAQRLLSELRRVGIVNAINPGLPRTNLLNALAPVADALSHEEKTALRRRHAISWVTEIRDAAEKWRGPQAFATLKRLEAHREDLSVALDFLSDVRPAEALELAASASYFWLIQGHHGEGRARLETLLQAAPPDLDKTRADALLASGHFANCRGDNRAAFARYREARALYHRLGDEDGIALTLMREGNAAMEEGNLVQAHELCKRAAKHFRQTHDEPNLVMALFCVHQTATLLNISEEKRETLADVLSLAQSLGDGRYCALGLYGKAFDSVMEKRWSAGASAFAEYLPLLQQRFDAVNVTYSLQTLVSLLAGRQQMTQAGTMLGIVHGLRRIHGIAIPRVEVTEPTKFFLPEALPLKDAAIRRASKERGRDMAHSASDSLAFALECL